MQRYDIYVEDYADKVVAVKAIMDFHGCGLADAKKLLEAGIIGLGVSRTIADFASQKLKEAGIEVYITESEEEEYEEEEEVVPVSNKKFNVPSLIAFIISLFNMFMAILGIFDNSGTSIGFCFMMAVPVIVLSIIGLRMSINGRGRKVFPLLALLFAIVAAFGSIILPLIVAFISTVVV